MIPARINNARPEAQPAISSGITFKRCRCFHVFLLTFLLCVISCTLTAQTYTLTHQIDYSTQDQNMWGPNWSPFTLDFEYELFSLSWDTSAGFSQMTEIFGDSIGVALDAGTWGEIASHFSMHGFTTGTVDVDYPVEIHLTFPDDYTFNPGEIITINSDFDVLPGWDLSTHFPSAGITTLDIDFGFGAHIDFITCLPFTPCDTIHIIPPINIPTDSITIFHINGETGYVVYPCIDEFGNFAICEDSLLPIIIPDWWDIGLTGEITLPYVETTDSLGPDKCLYAHGDSAYLFLNLDIIHFLTTMAGFIPPPQGPAIQQALGYLSGSYTFDIGGAEATIEWELLTAELDISSTNQQDFTFCPHIWTTLDFPVALEYWEIDPDAGGALVTSGVSSAITFEVDHDLQVRYPCFDWPVMDVGISHQFTNDFTNHTWDSIAFDFTLTALWFHFHLPIFKLLPEADAPPFCIDIPYPDSLGIPYPYEYCSESVHTEPVFLTKNAEKDLDYEFGPLIDWSVPLGYVPLTWYNNTWNLGGFLEDTVFPGTQLVPDDPMEISIDGNDVVCFGESTGIVSVSVVNGTPPFTFEWSTGQVDTLYSNSASITVSSGTYTVTVSDVNGCSLTEQLTIVDLNPEIFLNLSVTDVLCNGENTGSASVSASGGTPGYTYLWSPSGGASATVTNLYTGWHTVTVTDAIGCTRSDSIFVDEPDSALSAGIVPAHVNCNGGSDGSADLSISGGTPGYQYSWNNGAVTQDLTNIPAGTYTVVVTDANGCTITATTVVTQPDTLQAVILGTDVGCYGEVNGAADLTVTGGTPPYIYSWNNGSSNEDLTTLSGGTYTVTVTDAHACTVTAAIVITQPLQPLTVSLSGTDILCFGEHTGVVDLTPSGGTPDYTFSWSNGMTTEDIDSLAAGPYSVTVTDDHFCTASGAMTLLQPAAAISTGITPTNILCNGDHTGIANLTVSGGTPGYSYQWNNGFTSQDLVSLAAGQYSVTVTDSHGCTESDQVEITEPPELETEIAGTNILCNGAATGSVNLTVTGGVQPYSYIWTQGQTSEDLGGITAGTYSVVVTDANMCTATDLIILTQPQQPLAGSIAPVHILCHGDHTGQANLGVYGGTPGYTYLWSSGQTIQDIANLPAGTYTVTITDFNGCALTLSTALTEPGQPLAAVVTGTDILCHGDYTGAADLTVSGGTVPYTFVWSNGSHEEDLAVIPAGYYYVTVTDAHSCTAVAWIPVDEPDELIVGAVNSCYICIGDTAVIYASASGGVPAYTYHWSNGMTGTHISVTPVVTTNYSVYVSDVNGCTSYTATAHVFVYPPVTAALQDTVFDICPGNPVTVGINVSGGNSQYVYMIATEDSVFYAENNPFTIYPTETGDYTVTVADQCGSPQATGSFSVISHEAPEASVTFSTNRGCQPLTVQFNEFSPPEGQTYRWDFGDLSGNNISDERNPVHTYDHPGSYDVMLTITSSFGCQTTFPYNNMVSVYALPEASFSADRDIVMLVDPVVNFTDESVFGQTSSWDFGDGGTSDERNPAYFYGELGEYTVMLVETSQDGCTDTAYMDISVQGDLTFYAPDAFTPDDDGQNEEFFVYGVGIDPAHFYMVIYDRWGEVVFETRNPEKGWNGRCKGRKICKNGVYTWMVTFRDIWEVNTTKSGVVTLIR